MSTAIFENIIDSDFGGKTPSKSLYSAKKSDSFEFRDLLKDKTPRSESGSLETSFKEAPVEKVAQSSSEEVAQENAVTTVDAPIIMAEEVAAESVIIHSPLPVMEFDLPEESEVVVAGEDAFEEVVLLEEDAVVDLVLEEETEVPVIKTEESFVVKLDTIEEVVTTPSEVDEVVEQNVVAPIAAPLVENTQEYVAVEVAPVPAPAPVDLMKLSSQEQAMHQNLKTLELSNTSESSVIENELLFNEPVAKITSEEARKLRELLSKFETPVAIKVENISAEASKKPAVIPPLNLALADTTRHGSAVISRMQASDNTKSEAALASMGSEVILDTEAMLSDLSGKNDNSSSKSSFPLSAFGAVMQQTSDETFNVTFKGQLSSSQNNTPKPAEQVSLAIKEVLNASSTDGKKQITINLHPHTLGAIKVEILSQMGQDGASKVESIKISAEKNETLVMLEERKTELSKSLREVTSAKEEASLQFEMSQNQGKGHGAAYFDSLEERNDWMNQFSGLVADDGINTEHSVVDEYATHGILTEDKIDLVA